MNNPGAYIPEAVADAEHDLKLLAGIEIEWSANEKLRHPAGKTEDAQKEKDQ